MQLIFLYNKKIKHVAIHVVFAVNIPLGLEASTVCCYTFYAPSCVPEMSMQDIYDKS